MPCYNPLIGVDKGFREDGKRDIKIIPGYVYSSEGIKDPLGEHCFEIPCGHCIGCRTSQAKEWSNRLLLESLYHDTAYFVTLTYCDEYRPYVPGCNPETGEFKFWSNLEKSDIQKFIKRLRYYHPEDKIRYFLAGEYGDKSENCHWHMILFGLHLNEELIYIGRSKKGFPYYRSPDIERSWKDVEGRKLNKMAADQNLDPDLLGYVSVEPANYRTFMYVSQYVQKKIGVRPNEKYEEEGRVPPFSLSSRNPGLGRQFLEDHPYVALQDKITVGTPDGAQVFPVPRYYRKWLRDVDPTKANEISDRNLKKSREVVDAKIAKQKKFYLQMLEDNEKTKLKKLKPRDKI